MNTDKVRRTTKQRSAVRALLDDDREFRTAQQVHESLRRDGDTIGLATVYRALQALADDGEVDVLRTPDGELAYRHCSKGHHHHLVCRSCGLTVEIAADQVESWAATVASGHGFSAVSHDIELFGLCASCSAANEVLERA